MTRVADHNDWKAGAMLSMHGPAQATRNLSFVSTGMLSTTATSIATAALPLALDLHGMCCKLHTALSVQVCTAVLVLFTMHVNHMGEGSM